MPSRTTLPVWTRASASSLQPFVAGIVKDRTRNPARNDGTPAISQHRLAMARMAASDQRKADRLSDGRTEAGGGDVTLSGAGRFALSGRQNPAADPQHALKCGQTDHLFTFTARRKRQAQGTLGDEVIPEPGNQGPHAHIQRRGTPVGIAAQMQITLLEAQPQPSLHP